MIIHSFFMLTGACGFHILKEWLQLRLLTEVSFQPICLCKSIKQSTNRHR
ncbi:hypothetical protein NC651_004453 [Populus alba x Populus x berolinensis]|nr:hypothetical protein NC651_004453 [Populus alba x Populus x berolinensis]